MSEIVSRPKRRCRDRAAMEAVRSALVDVVRRDHPVTVRQVYYQMVSGGFIEKTELAYKATVVRLLTELRRNGRIPFDHIADNTRWMRKPRTYDSMTDLLETTMSSYRRAIWSDQQAYIEIWLEKDALSGVVSEITCEWDVPLMVTRGYPSVSFLHRCGTALRGIRKPVFLYYFGDFDPSGVDITRAVEDGIREFSGDADVTFERVAVTEGQIVAMGLPTRPTKKSDSRSKKFLGESVEVDAIPPRILKQLVEGCITRHIDMRKYRKLKEIEEAEQQAVRDACNRLIYDAETEISGRYEEDRS